MERLKRRQDFLAAARASYSAQTGFVLQARNRDDGRPARVGFTATKKLGNAVARNRVKRRLREIARLHLGAEARVGFDYVLIGRAGTAERTFDKLLQDLNAALWRLHGAPYPPVTKEAP